MENGIGIVGYGVVGMEMEELFPGAEVYDPVKSLGNRHDINECRVAFVCVPTPSLPDGGCDTSIVEEVVDWLRTELIIIRSTVAPGTTSRLQAEKPFSKIVFQPEYLGETVAHPFEHESERKFVILGGTRKACDKAVELYQTVYNASVQFMFMTSIEAEIVKYMENTAIATMVSLCNEFYEICNHFGVSYNIVREGFLMDSRMSRYFTFVYPKDRGFGGKCLPKDLAAIVEATEKVTGYSPDFIKAVLKYNKNLRGELVKQ